MERLMVLQVQSQGCVAEAWLNGVPLVRATAAQPLVSVAVHEYALAGANRLGLHINPPPLDQTLTEPTPLLATAPMQAQARLLLVRAGAAVDPGTVRLLAQCEWGLGAGESATLPLTRQVEVDLPLAFPRWRWLDAPVLTPGKPLQQQALAFVQNLALDLSRGQTEEFLKATRSRTGELAQAYQRDAASEEIRMRSALEQGYALKPSQWAPPQAADFCLRAVANGRLMECLRADGTPALASAPDDQGVRWALPLRLAWADGQIYVMR